MPGIYYTITVQEFFDWPAHNYDNPGQRTWLPPFAIVCQILVTFFVFGRLYLRLQNRAAAFGLDDFFIFLAWVFSVVFTVIACILVWQYGVGRHVWDEPVENWTPALKFGWLAQILFALGTGATKVSVLLFYTRLLRGAYNKVWLYVTWTLLFITVATWAAFFIAYCTMCIPLSNLWDWPFLQLTGQTDFNCIDGTSLLLAVGVVTVLSDFWTAALPCTLFQYHDLGVTRRQKIALNVIFCLGFIVTGIGISRTYFLWQIAHDADTSWTGYDLIACSVVESQLAIVCTCAPFLRAFFRTYFPNNTTARSHTTVNDHTEAMYHLRKESGSPYRSEMHWDPA